MLVLGFDPKLQLPVLDKWNVWRHAAPCGAMWRQRKDVWSFSQTPKSGFAAHGKLGQSHGESRRITENHGNIV